MKMINKQKNRQKCIEQCLDSDDEFPDDYFETPDVPAYLDDDRFEDIKFTWIYDKKYEITHKETKLIKEEPRVIKVEPEKSVQKKKPCNISILKGTLNKCDILCLKSVEKTIPNDVLLWFAKFLLFKDRQSHFMTPKSCLVSDSVKIGNHEKTMNKTDCSNRAKFSYRVIISKELTESKFTKRNVY